MWPLNRLDETGYSTTRLILILLIAGLFLGNLFAFFAYDRVPTGYYPPDDPGRWFVFALPVVSTCTNLAVVLLLARSTEESLVKLANLDPCLDGLLVPPSRKLVLVSFLLTLPIYIYFLSFAATIYDATLNEYLARVIGLDPALWVSNFLTYPIWVATGGYFLVVIISQFQVLQQIAQKLPIDLQNIQQYNIISEPFVRLAMVTALILSITQLGNLSSGDEVGSQFSLLLSVLVLVMLGGLAILYFIPVWMIRLRIRDEKQTQLELILEALRGNSIVTDKLIALAPNEPLTKTDLLTRQMFVESRWEWPVATHIQQLIIFGLLPPLTWVLAAFIENLLY